MTSVQAPALPDLCTEVGCREATSHPDTCRCSCAGLGHGIPTQIDRAIAAARVAARATRLRDPFLGAANHEEDSF